MEENFDYRCSLRCLCGISLDSFFAARGSTPGFISNTFGPVDGSHSRSAEQGRSSESDPLDRSSGRSEHLTYGKPIRHATPEEVVRRLNDGDLSDNRITEPMARKLRSVVLRFDMTMKEALWANIILDHLGEHYKAGVLDEGPTAVYFDTIVQCLEHPNYLMREEAAKHAVRRNLPATNSYVLARLEEMAASDPSKETAAYVSELLTRWREAIASREAALKGQE